MKRQPSLALFCLAGHTLNALYSCNLPALNWHGPISCSLPEVEAPIGCCMWGLSERIRLEVWKRGRWGLRGLKGLLTRKGGIEGCGKMELCMNEMLDVGPLERWKMKGFVNLEGWK